MNEKLLQISQRITELREVLDLTQDEAATKAGLPLAEYVAYENAKKDIPISALYAVASALGVDPTEILIGDSPKMNNYTVVRKDKGVSIERYKGYSFSALAFNYIGRDMEPMIVELISGEKPAELVTHKGQEFNYVLEGRVSVTLGGRSFVLEEGDCVYFDATMLHGQAAVTPKAKFLTIINEYSYMRGDNLKK